MRVLQALYARYIAMFDQPQAKAVYGPAARRLIANIITALENRHTAQPSG